MREGWTETRLGEVFESRSVRVGSNEAEPPVFSVTKHSGLVLASDYFERRVASDSLNNYKVLAPNDWAYSTIHIDEGSIARNNLGITGAVSPMYTTMRFATSKHEPGYFELLLRSAATLRRFASSQQGSINRRRSLPWRAFSAIQVEVPPLAEQRRIVDLIGAVDDTIAAVQASVASCRAASIRALAQQASDARTVPLADVFSHIIGGAWGYAPGVSEMAVLALGPKSYAARIDVDADAAAPRSLSAARAAERVLRDGDIVLERSGGSPTQPVGRVIRMVGNSPANIVPSDFQRLLRTDPAVAEPAYVFWKMWLQYELGAPLPFQKATTSIRNLNIPAYLAHVQIALPDRAEQARFVHLAESFAAAGAKNETAASRLTQMRSDLLTALLSGQHEIPESYDGLMEVAS